MIDELLFNSVLDIDLQIPIETCVDILGVYAHKSVNWRCVLFIRLNKYKYKKQQQHSQTAIVKAWMNVHVRVRCAYVCVTPGKVEGLKYLNWFILYWNMNAVTKAIIAAVVAATAVVAVAVVDAIV